MKKIITWIMTLNFLLPVWAWGEEDYGEIVTYRYNPILEIWEFEANKATIKYNYIQDEWTYAYPGEILLFNPVENDWDYQFPEKRLRFDMTTEKWFYGYAPPEKQLPYKELPPPGLTR